MAGKYGSRSAAARGVYTSRPIPKARHLPTHEMVGPWADNFGKWVHYKAHSTGEFRWGCKCGFDIKISVRVEKEYGARITINHRSASKQFTTVDPKTKDILDRCDQVVKFKHCGPTPWQEWMN